MAREAGLLELLKLQSLKVLNVLPYWLMEGHMIGMSSSLVFLFPPLTIAKILCILAVLISILSIFEKLIGYSLGWYTL